MNDTTQNPESTADELTAETVKKKSLPIRMGTIVWGLIIAVLGVLMILWSQGMSIDPGTAIVYTLLGAGVLLIVGSIMTAVRGAGGSDR